MQVGIGAGLAAGVAVTPLLGAALGSLLPVAPGLVLDWGALAFAASCGLLIAAVFAAPLRDLRTLVAQGIRAGEIRIEGTSADMRAWSLFDLTWMHENIVGKVGPRAALALARDTVLRGAARR